MMIIRNLILFLFCSILFACSGKDDESEASTPISEIPKIKIEKLSPLSIDQFESLAFEISYTDGDGDIGTEDADEHSLFILDTRDSIAHTFHIPPQSPTTGIIISGVLLVDIENVILLDQSNTSEPIVFEVSLKDREGNVSNTVRSELVTVNK